MDFRFSFGLLLFNSVCHAQFEPEPDSVLNDHLADHGIRLGNAYWLLRLNAVETEILDSRGTVVFSPTTYQGIGPVTHYSNKEGKLILRTAGRKKLKTSKFEGPDFKKTFYFVIPSNKPEPLSETELHEQLGLSQIVQLKWRRTNDVSPLVIGVGIVGTLVFVCGSAVWFRFFVEKQRRRRL
jgi:hypothetical protein